MQLKRRDGNLLFLMCAVCVRRQNSQQRKAWYFLTDAMKIYEAFHFELATVLVDRVLMVDVDRIRMFT